MKHEVRRLPDGTETTDVEAYISAWEALYKPIEKLTGWTCIAFDPGILLAKNGMTSWSLPAWFARQVVDLIRSSEAAE